MKIQKSILKSFTTNTHHHAPRHTPRTHFQKGSAWLLTQSKFLMEDLLSGKPMDNRSFQELFFLENATSPLHPPSASNNVTPEGPSRPHPPSASNNVTTEDPNLSVNTNWLSFFQKAKEKLLAEEDTQQNKSGLYDNHRERTHKKWWKKNSAGRTPTSSSFSSAASSTKNSVLALPADLEGEEMEASLAAQFDEEISRTSARFYPALPLRTDPLAENCDVEESRVTKKSICGEQKIKKNSRTLKHKKKSSANKGGGAFRSTELSKRYEAIQWGDVFDGSLTADCLFVRSALVRKDLLHVFDPDGLIVPRTHVVHSRQDVIDVTGENHIWVSKPPDSSNAIGIMIFDGKNVEQVSMSLFPSIQSKSNNSNSNSSDNNSRKNGECSVLQRYVQPLLLDSVQRRKFHLRQMMILQGGSMNSLDIWVWGDVRVLVSNLPWSSSDWDNVERHITNGSVNRQYDRYRESEQNKSMEDVWCGDIQQMQNLQKQMEHDLIKLMKNIHFLAKKSQFMSLPGTYEMFGIDWAIDNNNKGWILEVNPEPSMLLFRHMEGGRAQMIGGGPFGEPLEIGSVTDGGGLPEGWKKCWSSKLEDAMKRLKGNK